MLTRVMKPLKDPDSRGGGNGVYQGSTLPCENMFLRELRGRARALVIAGRVLCQQPEIHAGRE